MNERNIYREVADLFCEDNIGFYKTEDNVNEMEEIVRQHLTEKHLEFLAILSRDDLVTTVIGEQRDAAVFTARCPGLGEALDRCFEDMI